MSAPVIVAVPDLVSPSYFPAIAAVELGFTADEGVDARIELVYPVTKAAVALRDGDIEFLAGAAHAPLQAFPQGQGVKLLMALSRNTYWFLVMRSGLGISRGDLSALRNVRIGAAPGVDLALRVMLEDAGLDLVERGITIAPVPGTAGAGISFGVTAAEALAAGTIDGFWANGMGAEVAVRQGTGTVIIDARRGDGPAGVAAYTFPALAVTEETIATRPELVSAMSRAVIRAQQALRADPDRARQVGERLFPPLEASLIPELIRRDAPFYDAEITGSAVTSLAAFGQKAGLTAGHGAPALSDVVAAGLDRIEALQ